MSSKISSRSCRKSFRETIFVLLANIAPSLQSHVLDQMQRPRFVVADTMDLWIETTRTDLDALLPRVDLLILNDSEARQMTKETSLIRAGRRIRRMRPALCRGKERRTRRAAFRRTNFSAAAPIRWKTSTIRPGRGTRLRAVWRAILAGNARVKWDFADLRKAVIYGSVLASFNVESLQSRSVCAA